jgi:uncharacterized protein YndB with AHSA1/START domain
MATSRMSPNSDELISEIHIAAPPDRVFQALVDPQQVVKWWGREGIYSCTEYACDLRPAGKWRSAGATPNGGKFEVKGEFIEVDPPRLLAYTWTASWTGGAKTTVRWELSPDGEGMLVRNRHCGFSAHPELTQAYRGWSRMLTWLQAYLQTGETVDDRKPFASS